MKVKVGSKVHKSTVIKPVAGLIDFKGVFIKGRVWSKDGRTPVTYSGEKMATKMADRYGLVAIKPARASCWYLVKLEYA